MKELIRRNAEIESYLRTIGTDQIGELQQAVFLQQGGMNPNDPEPTVNISTNCGNCINSAKSCRNSTNNGDCHNYNNHCSGSMNDGACVNLEERYPDPGTITPVNGIYRLCGHH